MIVSTTAYDIETLVVSTTSPGSPFHSDHITVPISISSNSRFNSIHTHALVDSGATGNFISSDLVSKHSLPSLLRSKPVRVTTVEGCPLQDGLVTHDTHITLQIGDHSESLSLAIVNTPYPVILGVPWLKHHNPLVD